MMVSTSGALLERSIVDRMVGGPERLVFEGGPVLVPPLQQDKESRRPIAVDGVALDTVAACPPLSIVERARLDELKARERERLAPEMAKAREAFVEATGQEAGRAHRHVGERRQAGRSSGSARACCGRISCCRSTTRSWPGAPSATCWLTRSVYEGETLADPLEGVDLRPLRAPRSCAGPTARRGSTRSPTAAPSTSSSSTPPPCARRWSRRRRRRWWRPSPCSPPAPTSTRSSWRSCGSWRRSSPAIGLRAINAVLKAAQQQQAAQNAKAARAHQAASRRDPRPQIRAPFPDEPWLPQMDVLNEVIGAVVAAMPPARDIDGDAMRVRKLPVPNMHAFTDANERREGDDE